MKFPPEWKNKIHVPNHQPVIIYPFFTGYSWGYTPFSAVPRPVQALFVDPTGWSQLLEAQHIQGLLKRPAAGDVALQCGKPWGLKTNGIKPRQIYIYTLYIYISIYTCVYMYIYIYMYSDSIFNTVLGDNRCILSSMDLYNVCMYNVGYWLVWGYWIVSTDLKIIL